MDGFRYVLSVPWSKSNFLDDDKHFLEYIETRSFPKDAKKALTPLLGEYYEWDPGSLFHFCQMLSKVKGEPLEMVAFDEYGQLEGYSVIYFNWYCQ